MLMLSQHTIVSNYARVIITELVARKKNEEIGSTEFFLRASP